MPGSRTKTNTVLRSELAAGWFEHTPENTPVPERAGACRTLVVMLQTP
jgi:hypothetical protein